MYKSIYQCICLILELLIFIIEFYFLLITGRNMITTLKKEGNVVVCFSERKKLVFQTSFFFIIHSFKIFHV